MNMKTLYLGLFLLGTILPYSAFLPWLLENGVDPALFITQMFETGISTFFGFDVLVSALVVIITTLSMGKLSAKQKTATIAATCLIGVSAGLPLLLLFRENTREL